MRCRLGQFKVPIVLRHVPRWFTRLDILFLFAYAKGVAKSCRIMFTDGAGIGHTATVAANSLYEAAALGIAEFKRSGFAFGNLSAATTLTVAIEAPTTTHELTVGKLESWLNTNGKTPREQAAKVTLRQVLGRG